MKKTERHQIKRDELVTVLERGTVYFENNARRIGMWAALVVLVAAGVPQVPVRKLPVAGSRVVRIARDTPVELNPQAEQMPAPLT